MSDRSCRQRLRFVFHLFFIFLLPLSFVFLSFNVSGLVSFSLFSFPSFLDFRFSLFQRICVAGVRMYLVPVVQHDDVALHCINS